MKTMMRTSTATAAMAITATEELSISNEGVENVIVVQMALHYRCSADKADSLLVDSSLAGVL
jgi:hypothetical protein